MLCAYLSGRRWRWLASHPTPDGPELLLIERDGAVPGDPDGEIVAVICAVPPADLARQTRGWLERGLRRASDERPVDCDRPPAPTRTAVGWAPGDRRVDRARALAATAAAADGAPSRFCVFANPAAHHS